MIRTSNGMLFPLPPAKPAVTEPAPSWLSTPRKLSSGVKVHRARVADRKTAAVAASSYRPMSVADSACLDGETPNKTTRAIGAAKTKLCQIVEKKKSRAIKFVDPSEVSTPDEAHPTRGVKKGSFKMCQARTMSNKPCAFKATCGDFCKRHRIADGAAAGLK